MWRARFRPRLFLFPFEIVSTFASALFLFLNLDLLNGAGNKGEVDGGIFSR